MIATMMRRHLIRSRLRRGVTGDSGYALLAVIFLVGVMVLAAAVAAPVILTQGKREKEEELIWRGEQHVRAIRLYYRKYGRFPKELSDLSKAKNNIRFLRQPYKDVMNREDGSWRMIYVGPAGQLIGSVTRQRITGLPQPADKAAAAGGAKQPPAGTVAPPGGQQVRTNPNVNPNPNPNIDQNPESTGEPSGEPPTEVIATPTPQAIVAPKTGTADSATSGQGQVFGGNLIGVGSKTDKRSIKFYKGYGKYKEWEFIWDPQAEAAAAAGVTLNPQGGQQAPGQGLFQPPPQQPQPNPPQQ
jgi:type II secretory pathway pseudopilin PulG